MSFSSESPYSPPSTPFFSLPSSFSLGQTPGLSRGRRCFNSLMPPFCLLSFLNYRSFPISAEFCFPKRYLISPSFRTARAPLPLTAAPSLNPFAALFLVVAFSFFYTRKVIFFHFEILKDSFSHLCGESDFLQGAFPSPRLRSPPPPPIQCHYLNSPTGTYLFYQPLYSDFLLDLPFCSPSHLSIRFPSEWHNGVF